MFEQINDHDLARLQAKFVVPIVVDQMLQDVEPLDDVAEYAMNEILFELCPDTALLCLALCGRHVAAAASDLAVSHALAAQCDQIVDEYGAIWLANEKNPETLNDAAVRELLAFIPEDLESLRDLFEVTMSELEEDHSIAAILCDILSLQADHHRALAEMELENMSLRPQSRPVVAIAKQAGGNVIPFPTSPRRAARRQVIRH